MNSAPATVASVLAAAQAQGLDRLDAAVLLAHVLDRPRSWLIAHDTEPLADVAVQRYASLCRRRLAGEPVAYLVGTREFHGLALDVGPGVLVPRPDTETLVDWALELLNSELADRPAPVVIDLGTGSGAIALAVRNGCPHATVTATDRSAAALQCAGRNAQRLGLPLVLHQGDWWQAVPPQQQYDLVLSNPPYIAAGDPHLAALTHEPLDALTPGGDGLDAIRMLIANTPARLKSGGWLLLEHGADQGAAVRGLLDDPAWDSVQTRTDIEGRRRCTGARRKR